MKRSPYKIHPVRNADFSEWRMLVAKLWPDFNPRDFQTLFAAICRSPRQSSFLCRNEAGKAIAFANISLRVDYVEGSESSPVGYLEGIFVDEAHRKQGVARLLVAEAEKWAAGKGAREFASDTEQRNLKSQAFHKALGFRVADTIVHFIKPIRRKANN